ncbi:hypothetical protein Angca_001548, partial [Angiostrongylus cantonensis]
VQELTETTLPVLIVRNKCDLMEDRSFGDVKSTSRLNIIESIATCALSIEG